MGSMQQTMAFINSFLPTVCYAGLMIFAVLFWVKSRKDNEEK